MARSRSEQSHKGSAHVANIPRVPHAEFEAVITALLNTPQTFATAIDPATV